MERVLLTIAGLFALAVPLHLGLSPSTLPSDSAFDMGYRVGNELGRALKQVGFACVLALLVSHIWKQRRKTVELERITGKVKPPAA